MLEALKKNTGRLLMAFCSPHPAWLGLDRDFRKLMTLAERLPAPETMSVARLRRTFRLASSLWNLPPEPHITAEDEPLNDGLSLRWYRPSTGGEQGLVYFHGGGMVLGDLETHDRFCRRIARKRRMTVVAVHYRQAPEAPFPAGAEDAVRAWNHVTARWQDEGCELRQLGIGGDSSGGYLAAMVCQQVVRPGLKVRAEVMPAWQWLICPATDSDDRDSESWLTYQHSLPLTSPLAERLFQDYFPSPDQSSVPEASPILSRADTLSQLPPAVMITAEYDPLRDQGIAYARLLRSAGVAVVSHHESKMPHGYICFGGLSSRTLLAVDKAISLIDMICLQARRTLPGQVVTEEPQGHQQQGHQQQRHQQQRHQQQEASSE